MEVLGRLVLPSGIPDYFVIVGIEQSSAEFHVSLDELESSEMLNDPHFESNGFMDAVRVTDFPIRDHKVILHIRLRRWTERRTGKSFSLPIDLAVVCKGTRYSREFGLFQRKRMEISPVTCRTLEEYYHINAHTFERQCSLRTWGHVWP